MKILLDTHALLWALLGNKRLSSVAINAIKEAEEVRSSIVNYWEIGLKMGSGGYGDLEIPPNWEKDFVEISHQYFVTELPVTTSHCGKIQHLPFHHRDPFDRMLVAQALVDGYSIVSCDEILDIYGVHRIW